MAHEDLNVVPLKTGDDVVWLKDKKVRLEKANSNSAHWQYRIRIPDVKYKYERKTTGTPSLEEAKRIATDRYEEMRWLAKQGYSVFAPTFAAVAKQYLKHIDHEREVGRLIESKYEDHIRRINNYLMPYFGDMKIPEITDNVIHVFHAWRIERWRQQMDEKTPVRYKVRGRWIKSYKRHIHKPSSNSQISDEALIKHIFRHAVFLKLIRENEVPKFKYTKVEAKRRGSFTNEEWKLIYETLRREAHSKRDNKRLYYEAEMFRHFCLIMANAGTRPNEALHIKWSDVQYYDDDDDDDGETQVEIRIRDVGDWRKHRPRTFTAQPACHTYFERLRAIHKNPVDDAYVFERWTGARILAYSGRFNALMKNLNLYLDEEGKKRTSYSLRHYYATQRLENGADPYLLARYMGSSLPMLEKTYAHILSRRVAKEVTKRRSRKKKQRIE